MRRHIRSQAIEEHLDHGWYSDIAVSTADPMLITSGPMLCRLHIWTEEQWAVLLVAERPAHYTHAPGLGWVGALPIACMN